VRRSPALLSVLALGLGACSAAGPTATPPATVGAADLCDAARATLASARAFREAGRLGRADDALEARPICAAVDTEARALALELDAALGDAGAVDPLAELRLAREARDAHRDREARAHFARADRAYSARTGAAARVVALRPGPLDGRLSGASPLPARGGAGEIIWGRRTTGGALEPVRLVRVALQSDAVDGAAVTFDTEDHARLVRAEGVVDPLLGTYAPSAIQIAPTGRWIEACDREGARLFDGVTGARAGERRRDCDHTIAFASDTRALEVADAIEVVELPSLRVLKTLPKREYVDGMRTDRALTRLAYLDGSRMNDDEIDVVVIDLEYGDVVTTVHRKQPAPLDFALSPNGKHLLLVDEQVDVVDLDTRRTRPLGRAAFFPFRPGALVRGGYGDLFTPPAATGRVAALDDGRACIEQGGTPVLVPRTSSEHCGVGVDGFARVGRVRGAGAWVLPPKDLEGDLRTAIISDDGSRVVRLEAARPKGIDAVTYDGATGALLTRTTMPSDKSVSLSSFETGAARLHVEVGGSSQESGSLMSFDTQANRALPEVPPSDDAAPPWRTVEVEGTRLTVKDEGTQATQTWDLAPFGVHRLVTHGDALVDGFANGAEGAAAPLATITPLAGGLALFYPNGEVRLVDVPEAPRELVCDYDGVLAPFEVCSDRLLRDLDSGPAVVNDPDRAPASQTP